MKTVDLIEMAEEPLDVVLPLDEEGELREHFKIYDGEKTESSATNL